MCSLLLTVRRWRLSDSMMTFVCVCVCVYVRVCVCMCVYVCAGGLQWIHSRERSSSGSLLSIDWTADGTQLAGAGANGAIVFGQIVER